jgi:hypothetical protein
MSMPQEVVEVGLLLPADWAAPLIRLASERQQTVAQLLRTFVGRGLREEAAAL